MARVSSFLALPLQAAPMSCAKPSPSLANGNSDLATWRTRMQPRSTTPVSPMQICRTPFQCRISCGRARVLRRHLSGRATRRHRATARGLVWHLHHHAAGVERFRHDAGENRSGERIRRGEIRHRENAAGGRGGKDRRAKGIHANHRDEWDQCLRQDEPADHRHLRCEGATWPICRRSNRCWLAVAASPAIGFRQSAEAK